MAAKIAPDGQTILYLTSIGTGNAHAIAVDEAGNAYIAGGTNWAGFPTTKGAWGGAYNGSGGEAFVVKLDSSGNTVYSALFGPAGVSEFAEAYGIAVNAAGEAFVTGQTAGADFPLTPSPIQAPEANGAFLVRLSAAGDKPIYSIKGPGGTAIAIDEQDNVYVAGLGYAPQVPVTPNAFQTQTSAGVCGSGAFNTYIPCLHQYVCKVDAFGDKLYFCTFVSGNSGETRTSIALTSGHDIYLAGTTLATQYPITAAPYQSQNLVQFPPTPLNPPLVPNEFQVSQPTGFFTELSSDGTHLLYSMYLGGSQPDDLTGIAVDAAGNAYISALVQSPDFPGLPQTPGCLPALMRPAAVLTRLDGTGAHSVIVEGAISAPLMGFDAKNGVWLEAGQSQLTHISISGVTAQDSVTCLVDAMDYTQASTIAPGQLLAIFGTDVGPSQAAVFDASGLPPLSLGGVSVTIGGVPAPLLYVSRNQINLETPAIAAGESSAMLSLSSPGGATAQRTLQVAPVSPSLATNNITNYATCNGDSVLGPNGQSLGVYAMVFNQDGGLNSCSNPAQVGARVSVLLNGAGLQAPTVTAGYGNNTVVAVSSLPGLPGLWMAEILATSVDQPAFVPGGQLFTFLSLSVNEGSMVNGTPTREQGVVVWLTQ